MINELIKDSKIPDGVLTVRIFPDGVEYDITGYDDEKDRAKTIGIIFKILIDLTRPR